MKKNLENFHEILSVSKHSHSEVGFILVISLGPEGVGSFADHKGVGVRLPPAGGGALAAHGGHQKPPLSCQHWVWEGWWRGTITKMVKGIASWEFPKEQSLVEDKPESGTQKYSKCQTPPHMKKQVAFKWIFRWFYAFWDHIFLWKMTFSNPPTPLKFFFLFFWNLPFTQQIRSLVLEAIWRKFEEAPLI